MKNIGSSRRKDALIVLLPLLLERGEGWGEASIPLPNLLILARSSRRKKAHFKTEVTIVKARSEPPYVLCYSYL